MRAHWIFGAVAAAACAAGFAFAAAVPPGPQFDSEELAKGKFLIASPHSGGPYFHQSVVLLLEYGPMGAMGLIINRPTEVEFAQLFPDDETLKGRSERAFFGGPVERQRLLWLFRSSAPPPESRRVTGDIHVSGSIETLRAVVASGDASSHFRVYVGLAGWAPGQLEGEVARGGWLVAASDARAVFEMDSGKIWREFIERSFRLQAGPPGRRRLPRAAAPNMIEAEVYQQVDELKSG
jgi:putative transcriptional regulator